MWQNSQRFRCTTFDYDVKRGLVSAYCRVALFAAELLFPFATGSASIQGAHTHTHACTHQASSGCLCLDLYIRSTNMGACVCRRICVRGGKKTDIKPTLTAFQSFESYIHTYTSLPLKKARSSVGAPMISGLPPPLHQPSAKLGPKSSTPRDMPPITEWCHPDWIKNVPTLPPPLCMAAASTRPL